MSARQLSPPPHADYPIARPQTAAPCCEPASRCPRRGRYTDDTQRGDATTDNHKPDNTKLQTGALVDCATCGLPAEITDRFTVGGAPAPVEHVKIVCVRGHWYTLPTTMSPVSGCQNSELVCGFRAVGSRDRLSRSLPDTPGLWWA
jgi:hypothetical protein